MFVFQYQWINRVDENGEGVLNPQGNYETEIITNNLNYP